MKKLGRSLREGCANRAALVRLTSDLKLSNKGEDSVRSAARQRHHSPSQIAAETTLYLLRFMLEPRVNLAAIAARRAPPWLSSFQHSDIGATLSKVEGRRQSGKAAAHYDDAHTLVAAKRRRRDRVPRGFGIKATRQLVSFRFDSVGHVFIRLHAATRPRLSRRRANFRRVAGQEQRQRAASREGAAGSVLRGCKPHPENRLWIAIGDPLADL